MTQLTHDRVATDAEIVAQIDEIRADLGPRSEFRDPVFLGRLACRLEASSVLGGVPIVQAFVEDLRRFGDEGRMTRTKAIVNDPDSGVILGLFDASYFPSLSLDFMSYRTLPTDPGLAEGYPSPTMPVVSKSRSEGFIARPVVALFPENHIDGTQESDDLIFYFIDKLVDRHLGTTKLLIEEIMDPDAVPLVRAASVDELNVAASWWVRMHEFHHRQGDMPLPEFLFAKRSKALAGLEELRCDVSGMMACRSDARLAADGAALASEFILVERLLRYPVEGATRPNYDAVASQVLFTFLLEEGGIEIRDGRIYLTEDFYGVLRRYLDEVAAIEALIRDHPVEAVQTELRGFAHRYVDYDEAARDYRHMPYFSAVKERLGI
jgi:Family of unknown function (DUF6421)